MLKDQLMQAIKGNFAFGIILEVKWEDFKQILNVS